jgi:hypothetical protein
VPPRPRVVSGYLLQLERLFPSESLADHGEKLIHQQNVMLRNGMSFAEVTGLTADAYARITKDVPTATAADALRTITELRTVTGDTATALKYTEFALKIDALMSNLTGHDVEGAGYSIWRALEMKGLTASDPEAASKLADTMAQIASTSPGKLTPEQYQAFAKRGGAAWMAASPHLIAGAGSVLIGDMGGDTAGTAYSTFYNSVMGAAQMSRQQLEAYRSAGLIDESKVHKIKGSSNMQMDPGAIRGVLDYSHDLDQWVAKVMAPAFHDAAKKIAGEEGISEDAAYDALLAKAGRNKNTQRLMHMWGDPEFLAQIDKDRAIWEQAQSIDQAYGTLLGDPSNKRRAAGRMSEAADAGKAGSDAAVNAAKLADYGAIMKAFQAQWESMLQAVGGPVALAMIPVMKQMTAAFNEMGQWANAHGADISHFLDMIEEPFTEIADTLKVIGPPIATTAQEFADLGNSIVAFQDKIAASTRAFWKFLGIDYDGRGPLDTDARPGAPKPYDPLSSIRATASPANAATADPGYAARKRISDALNPPRPAYDPLSSIRAAAAPVVSVSPPNVNVAPTSVAVTVLIDSELVAQKFAESIARFGGFTTSSYEHDGRMGFAGPDVRN